MVQADRHVQLLLDGHVTLRSTADTPSLASIEVSTPSSLSTECPSLPPTPLTGSYDFTSLAAPAPDIGPVATDSRKRARSNSELDFLYQAPPAFEDQLLEPDRFLYGCLLHGGLPRSTAEAFLHQLVRRHLVPSLFGAGLGGPVTVSDVTVAAIAGPRLATWTVTCAGATANVSYELQDEDSVRVALPPTPVTPRSFAGPRPPPSLRPST
jgi:hypothetical protein